MNERKVLEDMLELLSNSDNWSQGAYARNKKGARVDTNNRHASSYCLLGAAYKVCSGNWTPYYEAIDRLRDNLHHGGFSLSGFNDSEFTTHEDVVLLIKNALYELNGEE